MQYKITGTITFIAALLLLNISQAITNSHLLDEIWRLKDEERK